MANEWIPLQKQLVPRIKSDSRTLYQKHARRKHKETVEIALKRGFLKSLDKPLILESQLPIDKKCSDLQQVVRINVSKCHVQLIDDIAILSCARLRICNLESCYVNDITAFYGCMDLLLLDVSNNQIGQLPRKGFWASLASLRVLYLHGNAVSSRECLLSLNGCPQLHVLTLHSTPLSLINNYRHHVVNSVLTLRALDCHVISDEEVIENLHLTVGFKPMSATLRLQLSRSVPRGTSFKEEIQSVYRLLLSVDQILARRSPVIIIQRWVRGWLTRKALMVKSATERTTQGSHSVASKRVISALVPTQSPHAVDTHILGLSSDTQRTKYTMHINLSKLQQNTSNAESLTPTRVCKTFTNALRWRASKASKQSPVRTLSDVKKSTDKEPFSVSGSPVHVLSSGELPDVTTTKKHTGNMIRSAEQEMMKSILNKRKSERKAITQTHVSSKDKQTFTRAYATMKTNYLRAVDNTKLCAENTYKAELVAKIKRERIERREKAKEFHRKLQNSIREWRAAEEDKIFTLKDKLQNRMCSKFTQCSQAHDNEIIASHRQADEQQFLSQFSHQNTLVSNTLAKEDLKASLESTLASSKGQVEEARAVSRENQLIVQRFMKLREAKLTQEGITSRQKLDAVMLQAASHRLIEVKKKVAREVARKQAARAAIAEARKELNRAVSRSGLPPPITAELQPLAAHKTPTRVQHTSRTAHRTWQRGSKALDGTFPVLANTTQSPLMYNMCGIRRPCSTLTSSATSASLV